MCSQRAASVSPRKEGAEEQETLIASKRPSGQVREQAICLGTYKNWSQRTALGKFRSRNNLSQTKCLKKKEDNVLLYQILYSNSRI